MSMSELLAKAEFVAWFRTKYLTNARTHLHTLTWRKVEAMVKPFLVDPKRQAMFRKFYMQDVTARREQTNLQRWLLWIAIVNYHWTAFSIRIRDKRRCLFASSVWKKSKWMHLSSMLAWSVFFFVKFRSDINCIWIMWWVWRLYTFVKASTRQVTFNVAMWISSWVGKRVRRLRRVFMNAVTHL